MRDVHVHFLHDGGGIYTREFFEGFIIAAQSAGLDEIYLLEHTHQFLEFEKVYAPIKKFNAYQNDWLTRRMTGSVENYLRFIETVKNENFPVKVKFGLEVCYIPEACDELANRLSEYDFDFLTGSVHWIDGWGFDHPKIKDLWDGVDVDKAYRRYYEIMNELCESGLFTGLAHPDSIKCFGRAPRYDLTETYHELAALLNKFGMYAENSGGLKSNYSPPQELGMDAKMLGVFKQNGVAVETASDAHKQSDTGKNIRELEEMLKK